MARLFAVVLVSGTMACGAGRYPAAMPARPLTLPAGEDQLAVWLGPSVPLNTETHSVGTTGSLRYRHGITDRLEYQFPLRLGYRWGANAGPQLALGGGLSGFGIQTRDEFSGDPREPRDEVHHTLVGGEFVVSGKLPLSPTQALFGFASAYHLQSFPSGLNRDTGTLGASFAFDATSWLTVAATLAGAVRWREEPDATRFAVTLGGTGADGYGPIPVLAFHVAGELDIIASPGLRYNFTTERLRAFGTVGIDWHWE